MKKVIDITEIIEQQKSEEQKPEHVFNKEKATNPIFKKLAQFKNTQLSKKFDINDLI